MTKKSKKQENEIDSLREYAAQAELVELLKTQPGWEIIANDLQQYKSSIGEKIAYLNPKSEEYHTARILYIAADKVLKIVDDYAENRRRALDLLEKLDNQQENIVLDVDNA
jgi:hypothetical protein